MKAYLKDRFKDKVMIITGSSRGIGKETAIRAALEGGKVVLCGRRKSLGDEIVTNIKEKGGEAIFVQGDLTKEESAIKLVETAVNTYVNMKSNNF